MKTAVSGFVAAAVSWTYKFILLWICKFIMLESHN
jgi:hypothetical protein